MSRAATLGGRARLGVRRPVPAPLRAGWASAVALLGLGLAVLGPAPAGPAALSPVTVVSAALARLPADAASVRVVQLAGWRGDGTWRFAVYLEFREGARLLGRSVILPAPPVGAVLPWPASRQGYQQGWPAARLQAALGRLGSAGCVQFSAPGPPGCAGVR